MHTQTAPAPLQALPPGVLRHLQAIRRLRERLFELQCEADPDPLAINSVMRRLARLRLRSAAEAVA